MCACSPRCGGHHRPIDPAEFAWVRCAVLDALEDEGLTP